MELVGGFKELQKYISTRGKLVLELYAIVQQACDLPITALPPPWPSIT
jgi:hypothetical protein